MNPAKWLRSTSFRLVLVYMGLFGGSVLLLLSFIYWSTARYMAEQADATIRAQFAQAGRVFALPAGRRPVASAARQYQPLAHWKR